MFPCRIRRRLITAPLSSIPTTLQLFLPTSIPRTTIGIRLALLCSGYPRSLCAVRGRGAGHSITTLGWTARLGFWRYSVTHAAAYDGGQLAAVLDRDNTASDVGADTAYRLATNLALLERRGLKPQFQRKKPRGREMPAHIARGNATRARVRSRVEHVFAAQRCRIGLVIRTVGVVRAGRSTSPILATT